MTETDQRGGKGRPTPKRSAARAARKTPIVAPKGRAAAKKGSNRGDERRKIREAMRTGDERNYPAIAAGPERALVRDVIDARQSFGWLAIPGWLLGVVLTMVPLAASQLLGSLLFPVIVVVLVGDSWTAARTVRKALDRRWPDGTENSRKSLTWYGVARNTQFRRQRLPRPRVERGAEV